jgi:hypothetical protein
MKKLRSRRYIKKVHRSKRNKQKGGECNPFPPISPATDFDVFTQETLSELDPDERINVKSRCYNKDRICNWIFLHGKNTLPDTMVVLTEDEKRQLKETCFPPTISYNTGYDISNYRNPPTFNPQHQYPVGNYDGNPYNGSVTRKNINKNKKSKKRWSLKYKRSIDCKHPKGFSQRQHCKYGRKNWTKRR